MRQPRIGPADGGFTLIELLIVVAIIAILAAIAVPNFLEAQVRSKVSRVKADMRAIATALEAYAVDNNDYPDTINGGDTYTQYMVPPLSTPVAYLTASASIRDPFTPEHSAFTSGPDWRGTFWYASYNGKWVDMGNKWPGHRGAIMASYGPDRVQDNLAWYPYMLAHPGLITTATDGVTRSTTYANPVDMVYDPTNGTRSWGDVGRTVGNLECEAQIGG